jgi:hypothetical protein
VALSARSAQSAERAQSAHALAPPGAALRLGDALRDARGDALRDALGASPSPPASLAGSGSSVSWMSVSFQSSNEEERFRRVCRVLGLIGYVFLFTASCSFFSSLYPVRAAGTREGPQAAGAAAATSVDAFVVTSNIIAIDLCSALFVICGFVAGYTHANMAAADWCEFSKIVSLYVLVDLWLSTCATLVLGSIFHLAKHSFRFQVRRVTRFVVCRFVVCRFVVCRFVVCRFVVCRFVVCRFVVRWRAERRRIIMTMLLFSAAPRAAMFLRCFRD